MRATSTTWMGGGAALESVLVWLSECPKGPSPQSPPPPAQQALPEDFSLGWAARHHCPLPRLVHSPSSQRPKAQICPLEA